MANLTYRGALAQNELVASGAGAGQENIDGTQVVGATGASPGFTDSGFTFNSLKSWIKLDADWMSKSVYDSGGTGRVDNAEQLNDGTNTVTAAQARSHIDDTSIHFVINDTSTAGTVAWSGNKINSELGSKLSTGVNVGTGEGNVLRDVSGTTFNLKTLKQAGNLTITDNANDITITASGEANTGQNVGVGDASIFRDKTGTTLNFKRLVEGANITLTDGADTVTIQASSGGSDLTDAVFPTWAAFQTRATTSIVPGGNTNVDWDAGNKHELLGSGTTTLNNFVFPAANAHYFLLIPSSVTISAVSASGKIEYGQNDFTPGKAHVMSIFWDGITAHWQTSEEP